MKALSPIKISLILGSITLLFTFQNCVSHGLKTKTDQASSPIEIRFDQKECFQSQNYMCIELLYSAVDEEHHLPVQSYCDQIKSLGEYCIDVQTYNFNVTQSLKDCKNCRPRKTQYKCYHKYSEDVQSQELVGEDYQINQALKKTVEKCLTIARGPSRNTR